jgi:tetratricopeptide (TPR) repeat protein
VAAIFILDVDTDPVARHATLRLSDGEGRHVGAHEVNLRTHSDARWDAAFDTRTHVRRMARGASPEAQLAELGVFLGEHVLGPEIAACLAVGVEARTLLVRVSDAPEDALAASFASIPWEIARAPGDALTLLQRAVTVRVALTEAKVGKDVVLAPRGEAVRVLLVFADPPEAGPLAARLERERLREMFFGEILPKRNVEVDVLCHGVTRARLQERITERGGYHVVHWSGHGDVNTLALADGAITGEALVGLFREAGGMVPAVMMLAACHSGAMAAPKDWASLRAEGEGRGDKAEGLAGVALALLRAGVKQVAAMRWEVGDVYARRLAKRFYRHLLADEGQHAVDKAVALSRGELLRDEARKGEYHPVDHATPLVLGAEAVRFAAEKKASGQMARQKPKPQPVLLSGSRELDPPRGFVGRGEELTRLFHEWMAREGAKPVALIQGLAGLGKTSLAAETVHLGFERFDYVLAFQAKGTALGIEEMYRRIDQRLTVASGAYRERCKTNEMGRVFVEAEDGFKGPERYEALAYNLVEVMGSERILLVLDNFETNLVTGAGGYACADPAWERLLEILSERLGETGSRVMMTSRHKPAVLEGKALWIPLGALPIAEAKLYFQNHAVLRALWYGDDASFKLAQRILSVSRGHPLILARIADLAKTYYDEKKHAFAPEGRVEIEAALNKIQGEGFKSLPDLFAKVKGEAEMEWEHKYLNDVAIGAVDLLIERLMPESRRLLWIVTRAGEPASEALLEEVWGSSPARLLGALCGTGLLTREREAAYAFHELVAERAADWMEKHAAERGDKTEAEVWKAFGEWYGRAFKSIRASRQPGTRDAAVEMGRRGIRYLVRARAFESLGSFASAVITSTSDPALLGQVIADLQVAAAEVPSGEARWSLRTYLADAFRNAGRPDQALPFYAQAAEEAEAAAHWPDVGWICQNWAIALQHVGRLERARETYLRSAEASRWAGRPQVLVVMSENEALRIDVMQGRAAEALPAIEEKLAELRSWWVRRQQGEPVPEAPDDEYLARALVSGLDVARCANQALERWQPCLDLLEEMEQVERALGTGEHEITRTRFNRYFPLTELGKLDEARTVLEGCLDVDRQVGDVTGEATVLYALASVWNALGDPRQALAFERQALALRERLPDPGDRAVSHFNLADYLHTTGSPDEARAHQLTDLVYTLVTGLDPRLSLRTLADRIRESASRGEHFALPRLDTLLATPAFAPLRIFLTERAVDLPALQARIDHLVAEARANP